MDLRAVPDPACLNLTTFYIKSTQVLDIWPFHNVLYAYLSVGHFFFQIFVYFLGHDEATTQFRLMIVHAPEAIFPLGDRPDPILELFHLLLLAWLPLPAIDFDEYIVFLEPVLVSKLINLILEVDDLLMGQSVAFNFDAVFLFNTTDH